MSNKISKNTKIATKNSKNKIKLIQILWDIFENMKNRSKQ